MKRGGGGGGGGGGAGAGMCPAAAPLRFTQGPGRLQTPPGTAGRDGAGGMGEGGASGRRRPAARPRLWGPAGGFPRGRGTGVPRRRPGAPLASSGGRCPPAAHRSPAASRVCLGRVGVVGLWGFGVGWWWFRVLVFFFFTLRHRNYRQKNK